MELRVDGSQFGGTAEVTYMRPYDAKKSYSIDGGKYVMHVLSRVCVCVIIERANDDAVNACLRRRRRRLSVAAASARVVDDDDGNEQRN